MTDDDLRERMAAARAEAEARIDEIDLDLMPKVLASERRGYALGDPQPPKQEPELPSYSKKEGRMTDAMAQRVSKQWQSYIAAEITAAVAEERKLSNGVHVEVVVELQKRSRAEIDKLQATIDGLTLRIDALAHELTKQKTVEAAAERAEIIDLPAFIGKRDARA